MTDTPIDTDTPPAGKVSRSRTAHGRLEGSGMDIYDFDPTELEVIKPKKKKKRKKRDGVVVLADESSSDGWTPGGRRGEAKIGKTSAKKATRSNTVGTELAPLLPKPTRRKPGTGFDGNLSLGLSPDKDKPSASSFVVDLTNDDLVLATQKKKEYDAVSSDLSASCNGVTPPGFTSFVGSSSDPSLHSTFLDPPEDGTAVPRQPWGLEYTDPLMPALKGPGETSPPALNPPSLEPSTESTGASPVLIVSPPGAPTDDVHRGNVKKRSLTDQGVPPQSVASEWRAAKAKAVERSKTLSDIPPIAVVSLSDGDYDPSKKKKKPKKKKEKEKEKEVTKDKPKRAAKKQKNSLDKVDKDLDLDDQVLAPVANPKVEVGSRGSIADSHDEEDDDDDDGDDRPVIPNRKKPKADAQDMLMVAVAIQPQQASSTKPKPKPKQKAPHSRRIVDSAGEDEDEEEAHVSPPAPVPVSPPTDTPSTPPPPPPPPTKRAAPEPAAAATRPAKRPKSTAALEAKPTEPPPPPPQNAPPSPAIAQGVDENKAKDSSTPTPTTTTPTTTTASTSRTTPTAYDAAGRVPYRVGLSRRSRIPSLLKVFRK